MAYVITEAQMQVVISNPATYAAFNFLSALKPVRRTWRDSRIEKLEAALRLVMDCAGDIQAATDAEIEVALSCGNPDTEKQANAWLVARAALLPDNA